MAQQEEKYGKSVTATGGSDDDSVMYEHRDRGNGVEPENHLESEYDIDFNTGE